MFWSITSILKYSQVKKFPFVTRITYYLHCIVTYHVIYPQIKLTQGMYPLKLQCYHTLICNLYVATKLVTDDRLARQEGLLLESTCLYSFSRVVFFMYYNQTVHLLLQKMVLSLCPLGNNEPVTFVYIVICLRLRNNIYIQSKSILCS